MDKVCSLEEAEVLWSSRSKALLGLFVAAFRSEAQIPVAFAEAACVCRGN